MQDLSHSYTPASGDCILLCCCFRCPWQKNVFRVFVVVHYVVLWALVGAAAAAAAAVVAVLVVVVVVVVVLVVVVVVLLLLLRVCVELKSL